MDPLVKAVRCRFCLIRAGHILNLPMSLFRHLAQQEAVDCGANAKAEDPRFRMFLDFSDDRRIIAHVAIGHETHHAQRLCSRFGFFRFHIIAQCGADGLHHLRASTAVSAIQDTPGCRYIFFGCRHWSGKQDLGVS